MSRDVIHFWTLFPVTSHWIAIYKRIPIVLYSKDCCVKAIEFGKKNILFSSRKVISVMECKRLSLFVFSSDVYVCIHVNFSSRAQRVFYKKYHLSSYMFLMIVIVCYCAWYATVTRVTEMSLMRAKLSISSVRKISSPLECGCIVLIGM